MPTRKKRTVIFPGWLSRLTRGCLLPPTLILMLALPSHLSAELQLPDMGESIDRFMTAKQEQELGQAFMRNIRRSLTIIDDPQIVRYIQSLGQRLAAHSDQPQQAFHFFVVDAPDINAFAGPGGYIGIHSGLILAAEDEDELAAVIAHELAHVTQRHLARAYQSAADMSLPLSAAIIAAIILGGQAELGQLGEATLATVVAGSAQKQINFTRSNEQEADRIGMQTLARAGYASDAMSRFFSRLLQANHYQEDATLEFLRTHPLTSNRIASSTLTPSTFTAASQQPSKAKQRQFALIQARSRVLTTTNPDALAQFFQHQPQQTAIQSETRQYGLALMAIQRQQGNQARKILAGLHQHTPDILSHTLASIENELRNGSAKKALLLAKDKLQLYPNDPPLTLLYARALLKNDQQLQARNLLRRHMHQIEVTPLLYSLLAEAEGMIGNRSATHQAMAEFYFLNGDSHSALTQIQLALDQDQDKDQNKEQRLNNNERLRLESRQKEIQQVISAEAGH